MKMENHVQSAPRSGGKKSYIEDLRAFATLAVVFLHVNMTLIANHSPEEIGVLNYAIFNDCYILVKWAVPCFIMISGALLLDPARDIPYKKIAKYIRRMVGVLLTFGVGYAFLELFFYERKISIGIVLEALFNTLQGKSWSHMWYIYMLIGLYLITVPLRYVVRKTTEQELEIILLVLMTGTFLIPSINTLFSISLENYMLISEYVVWFLLGYYLSITERKLLKYAIPGAVLSLLIMIAAESVSVFRAHEWFSLNHQSHNVFTLVLGASIFVIAKESGDKNKDKDHRIRDFLCANSFAVYLVHPIFINLIYKVLGFTPLSIPIIPGILCMFAIILLISLAAARILRWVPLLNKLV